MFREFKIILTLVLVEVSFDICVSHFPFSGSIYGMIGISSKTAEEATGQKNIKGIKAGYMV